MLNKAGLKNVGFANAVAYLPRIRAVGAASALDRVTEIGRQLKDKPDEQLRRESRSLVFRARSGESLNRLLPSAYALVREASRRVLGMFHYDVQVVGGIHLAKRRVLEMDTGEGKTLTATLPLYLHCLPGKGVHLATANDYLAKRDAETNEELFSFLGLTVGAVVQGMSDAERRIAYQADITYGTASEFGFDLLRDRVKRRRDGGSPEDAPVRRKFLNALIVDEADKLLIDESTTPLVLAGGAPDATPEEQSLYTWASGAAPLAGERVHYEYDRHKQKAELTKLGRQWARRQYFSVASGMPVSLIDVFTYLERAIKVHRDFHREKNYLIEGGEVQLIDENTGRIGVGREWHDGIQQAIQAREGLPITNPSGTLARVTLQAFFLAHKHLSGMTGTARDAAHEFRKVYRCRVVRVEPHRKPQRIRLPAEKFLTEEEMLQQVCLETSSMCDSGRSVLIGVRSVEASERLSAALHEEGIDHQLLNARHEADEAALVAEAGQPGRVTVATNMAGRGTDIKLHPSVKEAGGLHVIITQMHESRRIDRQLIGRCGRQGDPGSFRYCVHLSDDLLETAYGPVGARAIRLKTTEGQRRRVDAILAAAQRRVTVRNQTMRYSMLHQEERRLTTFWQAGIDPLIDLAD